MHCCIQCCTCICQYPVVLQCPVVLLYSLLKMANLLNSVSIFTVIIFILFYLWSAQSTMQRNWRQTFRKRLMQRRGKAMTAAGQERVGKATRNSPKRATIYEASDWCDMCLLLDYWAYTGGGRGLQNLTTRDPHWRYLDKSQCSQLLFWQFFALYFPSLVSRHPYVD